MAVTVGIATITATFKVDQTQSAELEIIVTGNISTGVTFTHTIVAHYFFGNTAYDTEAK